MHQLDSHGRTAGVEGLQVARSWCSIALQISRTCTDVLRHYYSRAGAHRSFAGPHKAALRLQSLHRDVYSQPPILVPQPTRSSGMSLNHLCSDAQLA